MKILFYLFVAFFVKSEARLFLGQCRSRPAPVVNPFDFHRYSGNWFEIEWYDDEYPTYDECLRITYTEISSSTFNTTLVLQNSRNYSQQQSYRGSLQLISPGKLTSSPPRVNYSVLATDYTHYAFVWDCFNVNATHYNERMWYFDRQPNPHCRPAEVQNLICSYFDERYIRKTYHGVLCLY